MTHILEGLTHKMESQPPKKEVDRWVLYIYINNVCAGNGLADKPEKKPSSHALQGAYRCRNATCMVEDGRMRAIRVDQVVVAVVAERRAKIHEFWAIKR